MKRKLKHYITHALVTFIWLSSSCTSESLSENNRLNPALLNLTPNTWVKIKTSGNPPVKRQQHAGIVYNTNTGTILMFGSDSHRANWDNSVYELDPFTKKWEKHYPASDKETYRINQSGHPVAGDSNLYPWAMHTFDAMVYDPERDTMIVTSKRDHTPYKKTLKEKMKDPTWIYNLKTRTWTAFANNGKKAPGFFGAATEYDPVRNTIVAYKKRGVWELGPDRKEWMQATRESHHSIHFNMVLNPKQNNFYIFGNRGLTNIIWIYTPGPKAGTKGIWEKRIPGGDSCPEDQHFPVAFDIRNDVFLLLPDVSNYKTGTDGKRKYYKTEKSITCIYDPIANRYTRIPNADMNPQKMNYMMIYDRFHHVFLLITGNHKKKTTVWAFKLDLSLLE